MGKFLLGVATVVVGAVVVKVAQDSGLVDRLVETVHNVLDQVEEKLAAEGVDVDTDDLDK